MFLWPLGAPFHERANCGGRGVQNGHSIFFNDSPEAIRLREIGRAFVHHASRSIRHGAIHDVAVTGHPANVGCAPEDIPVAKIKHIFCGHFDVEQITRGGVQNAFGFAGRAARIKNE